MQAFPTQKSAAFSVRLRAAVTERGLTLDSLQRRLGEAGHSVGRSTLSYWQNGHRTPRGSDSMGVVAALEDILHVPSGSLQNAVAAAEPTLGPPPPDVAGLSRPLDGLLDAIEGREAFAALETLNVLDLVSFGSVGNRRRTQGIYTLRARSDCQHYPVIASANPGSDIYLLSYHGLGGCRIGRVRRDVDANLAVAELVFDRELHRGDTHLAQFAVGDANRHETRTFTKLVTQPKSAVTFELSFHADRLPVYLEEFEREAEDGPDLLVRRRTLGFDGRIAVIRERARRGVLGLRWEYA